jgi:phosphohistidine phosphatase
VIECGPQSARRLYLLRHAKSSWDSPDLLDHDRPLSPRGRRAAGRIASYLRRAGIRPDLVLCSSAVRARQTLKPISAEAGLQTRIQLEPGLFGAPAQRILALLRAVDSHVTSVLVVAHNPGLQDLALSLAGDDPEVALQLREKFPTGALAKVVFHSDEWRDLSPETARVASLTLPRNLPD